uniref:Uncharacterized protein n=1 Tax=uncultured bacterium BLR18 TaxID=506518 RepID=C0INL8_9BACT|nr:hypothetical protein AKSOIL_0289 [uncultured bacterium BLR18]
MRYPFRSVLAAIAAAVMLSAPALADDAVRFIDQQPLSEVWINPGFYSFHFDGDKGLNNNNAGLGAEYRFSTVMSATAGRFYNSDRRYSNYAGVYWQPVAVGPFRLGAVAGAFNGYPRARNGGWFPAVIPAISYEYQRFGANIAVIPGYKDRLYGAVSVQLKFRIAE